MNRQEINQVQTYLRQVFSNDGITLTVPKKPNDPVEVWLGREFLGTLYRDEDEGEISYDFNMTILEVDLPAK
ncbi:DUF3126 family protein [Rhodospira trueperi]|uniref:DUF3126 family protein n=1 Tax=Rhodospira trueperi TaxID=69960 RepID=A0A1G6XAC5_9PROT|nr:DUF3126 family protein [Rhodospira trueperi]SDD75041.1 Protein of unknown function [Rhodospira trueperi]